MGHKATRNRIARGALVMTSLPTGFVAVVTGAASGIGAETARMFAREGAKVLVADIQQAAGEAVAGDIGPRARYRRVDVTIEADIAAVVDYAVSEFGRLDCMINNAGVVGAIGPVARTSLEAWDATMAILLRGVFLGMKHAARVMIPQGFGCILSVSSTAGIVGGLGPHAYTAAKHAIIGLTKSVASELAQHGVRANVVAPGGAGTAMTAFVMTGDPTRTDEAAALIKEGSPLRIAGQPADIAGALLYLASPAARYITGHTLVVDAGLTTGGRPSAFHGAAPETILEAGRVERPTSSL
jgi:NAD(P)-dependent dehydrogenase (short-subunit alcohol dehydrogenase family)